MNIISGHNSGVVHNTRANLGMTKRPPSEDAEDAQFSTHGSIIWHLREPVSLRSLCQGAMGLRSRSARASLITRIAFSPMPCGLSSADSLAEYQPSHRSQPNAVIQDHIPCADPASEVPDISGEGQTPGLYSRKLDRIAVDCQVAVSPVKSAYPSRVID